MYRHTSGVQATPGQIADVNTIVDMNLRLGRFLTVTVIGVSAVVAFTAMFMISPELRLQSKIPVDKATERVDYYNSLQGTIIFTGSKAFEVWVDMLLFPTIHTYLHNCSLYPGDNPKRVYSETKTKCIFWGLKLIIIFLNIGFASIYVFHADMDEQTIVPDVIQRRLETDHIHIKDSILRTAVNGYTKPFDDTLDTCLDTTPLFYGDNVLTARDIDTTNLYFGFPQNDWNEYLFPSGIEPTATLRLTTELHYNEMDLPYDLDTLKDLVSTGLNVIEDRVSRNQQGYIENIKSKKWGLEDAATINDVLQSARMELSKLFQLSNQDDIQYQLDWIEFADAKDLHLESLSIEVPVANIPEDTLANVKCGILETCIYETDVSALQPEVWVFPSDQENQVFLYGLGRYVTAGSSVNLHEKLSMTFGRLSWQVESLAEKYESECAEDEANCMGISLPLVHSGYNAATGMLLTSSLAIKKIHKPVPLLSLHPMVLPDMKSTWSRISRSLLYMDRPVKCNSLVDAFVQHIDSNHFHISSLSQTLQATYTSALYYLFQNGVPHMLSESSSRRLELMDDTTTATTNNEQVQLELRAPFTNSIATFIGCGVVCFLMVLVIFFPTARVKLSPNVTPAAQYVQILTDDLYPDLVHKKRLRFENGDALLFNEYVVDTIVLRANRDHSRKIYL